MNARGDMVPWLVGIVAVGVVAVTVALIFRPSSSPETEPKAEAVPTPASAAPDFTTDFEPPGDPPEAPLEAPSAVPPPPPPVNIPPPPGDIPAIHPLSDPERRAEMLDSIRSRQAEAYRGIHGEWLQKLPLDPPSRERLIQAMADYDARIAERLMPSEPFNPADMPSQEEIGAMRGEFVSELAEQFGASIAESYDARFPGPGAAPPPNAPALPEGMQIPPPPQPAAAPATPEAPAGP